MKRCILFFPFFLSVTAFSQDVIKRHDDSSLNVKVVSVNETSISFTYPGETVVSSVGRSAVESVTYASGREEKISDYVDISGATGFENVIITSNPNEIAGLVRLGEVSGRAGGYWSMRTSKGSERKATERIKTETAELGGHVLYIQQHESKGRGFYTNPESIQSGIAYGYKNAKGTKKPKKETDSLYGQ